MLKKEEPARGALARRLGIPVVQDFRAANVTFVDGGPDPIACDTGSGNALIDDFMRARTGAPTLLRGGVVARP